MAGADQAVGSPDSPDEEPLVIEDNGVCAYSEYGVRGHLILDGRDGVLWVSTPAPSGCIVTPEDARRAGAWLLAWAATRDGA